MKRRTFLGCGTVAAGSCQKLHGAELEPAFEVANSRLLDLSPDGKLACLELNPGGTISALWTGSGWSLKDPGKVAAPGLLVLSLEDLKEVFRINLGEIPLYASFFMDSSRLLVYGVTADRRSGQSHMIDRFGKVISARAHSPKIINVLVVGDVGVVTDPGSGPRLTESGVIQLMTPDGTVLKSVPFAPEGLTGRPHVGAWASFSGDRKYFLIGAAHRLVMRKCEDLSLCWISAREYSEWHIVAISCSSNGSRVAVLMREPTFYPDRKARVSIVDGVSGKELNDFSVGGENVIRLSANGENVAVGVRSRTSNFFEEYDLDVVIYDAMEGKEIRRIHHDRVKRSDDIMGTYFHHDSLSSTSDGKYLVTTGRRTKFWRV